MSLYLLSCIFINWGAVSIRLPVFVSTGVPCLSAFLYLYHPGCPVYLPSCNCINRGAMSVRFPVFVSTRVPCQFAFLYLINRGALSVCFPVFVSTGVPCLSAFLLLVSCWAMCMCNVWKLPCNPKQYKLSLTDKENGKVILLFSWEIPFYIFLQPAVLYNIRRMQILVATLLK